MNSRLLNIPAILLAVLTISVGTFIYNSSQSTITDAMDSLSTQEKETFNSLFAMYEGKQTGSNVKALMGKLISNANTNSNDYTKIPYVYVDQLNETSIGETEIVFKERDEGDVTEYINELNKARSQINTKHEYYIEMSYQSNGLIDYINISFDSVNTINDVKHRDQKTNLFDANNFNNDLDNNIDDSVDNNDEDKDYFDTITIVEGDKVVTFYKQEVDAFNNQFISYEGYQTGSNIKALMGRLIANADTYRDDDYRVPYVYIDQLNQTQFESNEAIFNEGMEIGDYINVLGTIRNKVETKHEYHVKITYQEENGLIDYIQITYDSLAPMEEEKHR